MNADIANVTIPAEVLRTWQVIVDLVAKILHVPSAVVTKLEPPLDACYMTVVSSHSAGNPFPVDQVFGMDIGTFCETVIKKREPLLVVDARADPQWRGAPELTVGMVSYLGFPVAWPDGRMFGTICVLDDKANHYSNLYQEVMRHCRDVLEGDLRTLARLGSELEEQKAYLTELFARVPEAIVIVDRDGRITRVNPEFTRLFGYEPDEAIGQRVPDLLGPEELHEEVESVFHRMARGTDVFGIETVRKHKSGARVPVSLTCVPVASSTGGDTGYIIYRDISETKRLQNEQRRYHEMQLELAQAHRIATIAQLSAAIAHELNQPLTGVVTNSGTAMRLLAGEPPNVEGAREAVRRTMRDGRLAADVISRLRDLFNRQQPTAEPIDLNAATREVVALSHGELQESRVILRTELAENLPPVDADRVQLQQVVLNLLRNALDAMSTVDDRPRLLVVGTAADGADSVRLMVTDTGVGFDPATLPRLFDAFYSTKTNGMGVGLSVSRSIIENHGGRLWAALNDGVGATFSFSIPHRGAAGSRTPPG